jgi:hypothetical protein
VWPVSGAFLQALRQSHPVVVKADLYLGNVLLRSGLPVHDGTLNIDAGSPIRRTATVQIAGSDLIPWAAADVLAPYGDELQLSAGVQYPDQSQELVPVGRLRIDEAAPSTGSAQITLQCSDRTKYMQEAQFLTPQQSITSNTIVAEITRLLHDVLPGLTVTNLTTDTTKVSLLSWAQDRWGAIADLATSIGAEVVMDPQGTALIRPVPTLDAAPVWTVDAGTQGVMVSAQRTLTRQGVYNIVVVTSNPVDGTPPIQAVVTDTDPQSATQWPGPFGQVPRFYTSPTITSTGQATAAAQALLAKSVGAAFSVTFAAVPNPALDGGDVIQIVYPTGQVELHMIQTLAISLSTGAMTGTTRSNKPDEANQ